jgi:hypothetical protein
MRAEFSVSVYEGLHYGEILIKRQQGCIRAEILLMLRGFYNNHAS